MDGMEEEDGRLRRSGRDPKLNLGSWPGEQLANLRLKHGGFGSSDVAHHDPSAAVDHKCNGKPEDSPILFGELGTGHRHRVVHPELLLELPRHFFVIVHGNPDDLQTLPAVSILHLDKVWNLLLAGLAP